MRIRTKAAALTAATVAILVGATGASAITNGTPDGTNHPYVGVMVALGPEGAWLCSGSLLSKDVFLTAGHCTAGADIVFMWFGQSLPTPLTLASLANADAIGTAYTNPDACLSCGNGLPGFAYRDVGIVTLDVVQHPIPSEFATLPAPGQVDSLKNKAAIDFVGYGVTYQAQIPGNLLPPGPPPPLPPPYQRWDGLGTRMYAPSELVAGKFVHSAEFMRLAMNASRGSGGTCFGDSGGPDLLGGTPTVLGVNSYGANPNCSGVGYAQRIDIPAVLDWIKSFL